MKQNHEGLQRRQFLAALMALPAAASIPYLVKPAFEGPHELTVEHLRMYEEELFKVFSDKITYGQAIIRT